MIHKTLSLHNIPELLLPNNPLCVDRKVSGTYKRQDVLECTSPDCKYKDVDFLDTRWHFSGRPGSLLWGVLRPGKCRLEPARLPSHRFYGPLGSLNGISMATSLPAQWNVSALYSSRSRKTSAEPPLFSSCEIDADSIIQTVSSFFFQKWCVCCSV